MIHEAFADVVFLALAVLIVFVLILTLPLFLAGKALVWVIDRLGG